MIRKLDTHLISIIFVCNYKNHRSSCLFFDFSSGPLLLKQIQDVLCSVFSVKSHEYSQRTNAVSRLCHPNVGINIKNSSQNFPFHNEYCLRRDVKKTKKQKVNQVCFSGFWFLLFCWVFSLLACYSCEQKNVYRINSFLDWMLKSQGFLSVDMEN